MSLEGAIVYRMKTFNLKSDEWEGTRDREGWRVNGTLVGQRIGGELIGATLSEIEPGSRLWPYHTHYLNEEWVIVPRGEPTLRTPEGEHVLRGHHVREAGPAAYRLQAEFRELWEEFETPNGAARQVVPHLRGRADATKLPASAMVMA
jgi:hypothetical protein